ncbi:MAG TPA: hypothetical protein VKB57_18535 [Acidimicrobiales bacterium]|nr:hypothetical protein [Acidimicrobiales bacterium]
MRALRGPGVRHRSGDAVVQVSVPAGVEAVEVMVATGGGQAAGYADERPER